MKRIILGLVVGLLIGSSVTAIAATNQTVKAVMKNILFQIDDQEPQELTFLVYEGTSYLPVRKAGEVLGYEVGYQGDPETIMFNTPTTKDDEMMMKENTETLQPEQVRYRVGEEFTIGTTTIKLNSVEYVDTVRGNGGGFTPREGEVFALINFDVLTEQDPAHSFSWPANVFVRGLEVDGKLIHEGSSTGDSTSIKPNERKTVEVFISLPEGKTASSVYFKEPNNILDSTIVEIQ